MFRVDHPKISSSSFPLLLYFRWDPLERLTPEEGLRHPWIVETKLKRSSRESRTRYRAKKEDNNTTNPNGNNISGNNGDSCKTILSFIHLINKTFFHRFQCS